MDTRVKLAFVCVGAGRAERFGSDKLAEKIGRRTVFGTAIAALAKSFPEIPIYAVVAHRRLDFWRQSLSQEFTEVRIASGGDRRQDSVRLGVEMAAADGADVVAVHDAARPLVDPWDVEAVVRELGDADGAILSTQVSDTVKQMDEDGRVARTLDRENLRLALTPQVFRVASLEVAWEQQGVEGDWTDESALLEGLGMQVRSVGARYPNPKITTQSDLQVIRALAGVVS